MPNIALDLEDIKSHTFNIIAIVIEFGEEMVIEKRVEGITVE